MGTYYSTSYLNIQLLYLYIIMKFNLFNFGKRSCAEDILKISKFTGILIVSLGNNLVSDSQELRWRLESTILVERS